MNRKDFIVNCGAACIGGSLVSLLLESCASAKRVNGVLSGSDLVVQLKDFETVKKDIVSMRSYLIVQNDKLEYPIGLFRLSETSYTALLMKCSHQGTELQVFGDKLHCPAHGSEFNTKGGVENGPAVEPLRTFSVVKEVGQLKISLK